MFLADLHVHSNFSDGQMSISELVDFYGTRGFGCIAITDHICEEQTFLGKAAAYLHLSLTKETFPSYMKLIEEEAARARDQYNMIVIPGFELSKNSWSNQRSAHILGLGVDRFVHADADILDLTKAIRAQGALSIAAHPVSTGKFEPQTYHLWSRRDEFAQEFDAWEIASGPHIFEPVRNSRLPVIATSDLHRKKQINAWKTRFSCERHPEAIFEAIRKQDLDITFYREQSTQSELLTTRRLVSA